MVKNSVRIHLKAYEYRILDISVGKIVQVAQTRGAKETVGPVPFPTKKRVTATLRAVHKHKDFREQPKIKTYKRLIEIVRPTAETVGSPSRLKLSNGVDIEIKP